jgi:sugar lactone lactonase YvrE
MSIPRNRRRASLALLATAIAAGSALTLTGPASAGTGSVTAAFGSQTTVGFDDLTAPSGVAVSGAAGSTVLATTYGGLDLAASVQSIGPGAQSTVGFGELGSPYGLARDASGNVYVSDISDQAVYKLPAGGGAAVALSIDELSSPAGIAVDAAGNVYVADSGNARVVKEPAGGGAQSTLAFTGLVNPYAVAVDASGNVFVADVDNDDVKELPAGGGAQVTLGFTGLNSPDGLAVAAGTVYVADADNNRVVTLPVAGGTQATLGFTGLSAPAGIAVSTNGSVFVADTGNDRIVSLPVPANSPKQAFVIATYTDYIQRTPTTSELSSGVASISDVTVVAQRAAFAKSLANTDKYLGAFVNKLYNDTLGRNGDSGGVAYWTKKLRAKSQTPAQVSANFYASNEYFNGFGKKNNTDWVKDLYQKVLLRPATSAEVTAGVKTTVAKGRYSYAYSLFNNLESRKVRVTGLYQRFLGRNPDPAGRDYWAGKVLTQGDLALAFNLSSSNEYFNKSLTRFP